MKELNAAEKIRMAMARKQATPARLKAHVQHLARMAKRKRAT